MSLFSNYSDETTYPRNMGAGYMYKIGYDAGSDGKPEVVFDEINLNLIPLLKDGSIQKGLGHLLNNDAKWMLKQALELGWNEGCAVHNKS